MPEKLDNSSDSESQSFSNMSSDDEDIPLSVLVRNSLRDKGWKRKASNIKMRKNQVRRKSIVLNAKLKEKLQQAKKTYSKKKITSHSKAIEVLSSYMI